MDILRKSLSLKYAVIERKEKIYAIERSHLMNSDRVLIWVDSMLSARSWRGAIISDRMGVNRMWSPFRPIPVNPYQV